VLVQTGGTRRIDAQGSVVDGSLKPLPGVTVAVERQSVLEAKTTTRAWLTFAKVAPGPVRVRAELKGLTRSRAM
jgi:hypothetical protein